ncbi:hypothetical protein [Ketobacter sp.]|uniref:hypothetical protein n=1 Tax=Ketobacter sp. TaxID=2083498 RepID=UPI0025B91BCA|nr:hypothetical protein [Ketobacter sp.]
MFRVKPIIVLALMSLLGMGQLCHAQVDIPEGISDLDVSDLRQAVIAFVNIATAPGVEGSALTVDKTNRQSDLWRSSLGFSAEFRIKPNIYNGYWGLSLIGGGLDDRFVLVDDFGDEVDVQVKRNIAALRGNFGLSFPIDQHFKVRPFASLIVSHIETESTAQGALFLNSEQFEEAFFRANTVDSVTGVASVDLLYSEWGERLGVDLMGRYNIMYTDTFSEENAALDTWDWSHSMLVKGTLSGPTEWHFRNQKWYWNTYYSYNAYLDQKKSALGFNDLHEIGVGLDWDMHIKPLDWFGWRYIGVKAGYSFSDDVSGFNIGVTAR